MYEAVILIIGIVVALAIACALALAAGFIYGYTYDFLIGRWVDKFLIKKKLYDPNAGNNIPFSAFLVKGLRRILFVIPIFISFFIWISQDNQTFINEGTLTVGEVTSTGVLLQQYCYVNPKTKKKICAQEGIFFTYFFVTVPAFEKGDKFVVILDAENPKKHRIVWSKKIDKKFELGSDLGAIIDRKELYVPPSN